MRERDRERERKKMTKTKTERERERESVCVCVCVCVREREREWEEEKATHSTQLVKEAFKFERNFFFFFDKTIKLLEASILQSTHAKERKTDRKEGIHNLFFNCFIIL